VILTFVDGDPDRPIIAATVPNPQTASPVTSGNAPRNVIRTGSGNEINIDDTKDGQRIKLSTPKKNTTLQLGYRNAPEDGVALETQGAYSAVAVSGISHIGSFSASISAINKYLSGGRISSIAEKPGPLAGFLTAVELVKILTETADTILGYVEFQRKERERELKKQSIEKQKTAVDAEKSRKEKQKKAAEALAKAKAKLADSSAVAQAEADYLAAQQQYEADLLLYRTNMEWLTEAKKGEWVPNEQTAAAPYTFGSAAQVEYYTGEVDTSKKAVYGDPEAQDADAQKGSKKRYEEARAAYLQALKDALAAEGLSDAEIAAATEDGEEAIGDEGDADTVAQDTWADADAAKNTYNTMTGVNELGDEAINVKKAKTTIEYLKAAEGLISEAVGAYTAVKELLELLKDQAQDLEAMTSAGLSFPREKAAILAGYDLKPKLINHTLGSAHPGLGGRHRRLRRQRADLAGAQGGPLREGQRRRAEQERARPALARQGGARREQEGPGHRRRGRHPRRQGGEDHGVPPAELPGADRHHHPRVKEHHQRHLPEERHRAHRADDPLRQGAGRATARPPDGGAARRAREQPELGPQDRRAAGRGDARQRDQPVEARHQGQERRAGRAAGGARRHRARLQAPQGRRERHRGAEPDQRPGGGRGDQGRAERQHLGEREGPARLSKG
jgi:hypothetical protein